MKRKDDNQIFADDSVRKLKAHAHLAFFSGCVFLFLLATAGIALGIKLLMSFFEMLAR